MHNNNARDLLLVDEKGKGKERNFKGNKFKIQ
jgi:hypothetical protein